MSGYYPDMSRHQWISFYLGVLSDDLVSLEEKESLPLSEHQAILASGHLGTHGYGSIWMDSRLCRYLYDIILPYNFLHSEISILASFYLDVGMSWQQAT